MLAHLNECHHPDGVVEALQRLAGLALHVPPAPECPGLPYLMAAATLLLTLRFSLTNAQASSYRQPRCILTTSDRPQTQDEAGGDSERQ